MSQFKYGSLPLLDRARQAEEMLGCLLDKANQSCALAMAICELLEDEGAETREFRLAQVLVEHIGNFSVEYMLKDFVGSIHSDIKAQETAS
ncbi:hypothetical protein [Pseudothauera lacus]|uniref:Uncharacterized protein n=1 Tax=Pseudothauera lacus TaxID=2136175 RepID=A0A2T4IF60_9RHOO|nr:hypothetical protein [Pseudothauera lacus]PTD96398.1 hypothetical protein C8261_08755 [Pseudothauera lacus]